MHPMQRRGEMPDLGASPSCQVTDAGTRPSSTSFPAHTGPSTTFSKPTTTTTPSTPSKNTDGKLTPEERRRIDFETRVAFLGFMLHTMVQMMHIDCPWHERWQRIVSIPYTFAQVAFPLSVSGQNYLQYHDHFHWVFKVGFFMFPLLRRARGTISDILFAFCSTPDSN